MELRLKEILEERRIEQKELAEMTGLSTRTVSQLCSGKMKRYPREALIKIIHALEIEDANELFKV